jgi:hypothetical protein
MPALASLTIRAPHGRPANHASTPELMPSLLLVDDHAELRDVLRLHAENRGVAVVGEAVR